MMLRVAPDGEERDKDLANAILYAVKKGARVINMSFGKSYSQHKEALDSAVRLADSQGVLIVHSAGNDAKDLTEIIRYPSQTYSNGGQAKNWIEVGASGPQPDARQVAAAEAQPAQRHDADPERSEPIQRLALQLGAGWRQRLLDHRLDGLRSEDC